MLSYTLLRNTTTNLQPTETAPAYKFNLQRNIGVGCKIGQDEQGTLIKGKAPWGNEDNRTGKKYFVSSKIINLHEP